MTEVVTVTLSIWAFDMFGMLMAYKSFTVSDFLNLFSALLARKRDALGSVRERTVFTGFFKVESHIKQLTSEQVSC